MWRNEVRLVSVGSGSPRSGSSSGIARHHAEMLLRNERSGDGLPRYLEAGTCPSLWLLQALATALRWFGRRRMIIYGPHPGHCKVTITRSNTTRTAIRNCPRVSTGDRSSLRRPHEGTDG